MDDAIYVIDRIEEGIAVLVRDSGEKMEVPLSSLPSGAHEGSSGSSTRSSLTRGLRFLGSGASIFLILRFPCPTS